MKNIFIMLMPVLFVMTACTWVKPTDAGSKVAVVESFNVTDCKRLGSTTSSLKHKIGSMDRKPSKVTQELITLGRNEAAVMGGDSLVSKGPAKDGAMSFDVYRCAK